MRARSTWVTVAFKFRRAYRAESEDTSTVTKKRSGRARRESALLHAGRICGGAAAVGADGGPDAEGGKDRGAVPGWAAGADSVRGSGTGAE